MTAPRREPLPPWFAILINGYFRALRRRGRQLSTLESYRTPLHNFSRWLASEGVTSLEQLERRHVEDWQDSLVDRWVVSYRASGLAPVKGLLKWCAREELPLSNPMLYLQIDSPKVPPLSPRPIPLADLRRIQSALAEPGANVMELRTRAMFWALYSSGSRITALLSLDRDSIRDGQAVVIQKGGTQHTLLFSELALEAIADYLSARQDDEPALFVGHPRVRGGFRSGIRLCSVEVDLAWNRFADQLGIPRFSSHRIRHSCATALLRNKVDSLVISKHLGWRSPAMVQNYAEVAMEQRQEAMAALRLGA